MISLLILLEFIIAFLSFSSLKSHFGIQMCNFSPSILALYFRWIFWPLWQLFVFVCLLFLLISIIIIFWERVSLYWKNLYWEKACDYKAYVIGMTGVSGAQLSKVRNLITSVFQSDKMLACWIMQTYLTKDQHIKQECSLLIYNEKCNY